jgi:hypothetical protein
VGTTKEYVEVEKLETYLGSGVWCAKVKAGEPSTYKDNKCTELEASTGKYIKVLESGDVWEVCEENKETPKEPPAKYDEHKCNTQTKSLSLRHWEWKVLEAGKSYNIESEGTNQVLRGKIGGAAIEIKCGKVKDTGNIKGGKPGTDEGTIEYTECEIVGAPTCGVKSPPPAKAGSINLTVKSELVQIAPGVEGVKFFTASGTFVELELGKKENATTHEFEEKCGVFPLAKQKVTGVVVGKAEKGAGGNLCEKVNFTTPPQTGSTLKFGGEPAEYIGVVNFKLANGWAFRCS